MKWILAFSALCCFVDSVIRGKIEMAALGLIMCGIGWVINFLEPNSITTNETVHPNPEITGNVDKYLVGKSKLFGPIATFCAQEGLKEGSIVEEGKDFVIEIRAFGKSEYEGGFLSVAIPKDH